MCVPPQAMSIVRPEPGNAESIVGRHTSAFPSPRRPHEPRPHRCALPMSSIWEELGGGRGGGDGETMGISRGPQSTRAQTAATWSGPACSDVNLAAASLFGAAATSKGVSLSCTSGPAPSTPYPKAKRPLWRRWKSRGSLRSNQPPLPFPLSVHTQTSRTGQRSRSHWRQCRGCGQHQGQACAASPAAGRPIRILFFKVTTSAATPHKLHCHCPSPLPPPPSHFSNLSARTRCCPRRRRCWPRRGPARCRRQR